VQQFTSAAAATRGSTRRTSRSPRPVVAKLGWGWASAGVTTYRLRTTPNNRAWCGRGALHWGDGHHKMSDLGGVGEAVHSRVKSSEQVCQHWRRMVRAGLLEKLMTKTRKSGSHEAAMLADSDIVSNTKSTAASDCSLRDAELAGVSGGRVTPGGGFPLGVVYKPGVTIKTR